MDLLLLKNFNWPLELQLIISFYEVFLHTIILPLFSKINVLQKVSLFFCPACVSDLAISFFSTLYGYTRGASILGEVRNVWISRATQQLLCSKSNDFLAVFALATDFLIY